MWLDPTTTRVLKVEGEERRPMRLVFHLQGELLAGPAGSVLWLIDGRPFPPLRYGVETKECANRNEKVRIGKTAG